MYLKKITKNNVQRLYFYESIYDPETKKVRQQCKKSLGSTEELKKLFEDPIAHFTEEAKRLSAESQRQSLVSMSIDMNAVLDENTDNMKNVGYVVLKNLYRELQLDRFWKRIASKYSFEYDIEKIFQLLVLSRIMNPNSKKKTYETKENFFESFGDFSMDDVYHSLDVIAGHQEELQQWIFSHSEKIFPRDMSISYFDCTNYYFDIGSPDLDTFDENGNVVDKNGDVTSPSYRKRGPEKNHRPDPIVEMGLMMDKNGIPLAYDLFPGNESEKIHMRPIIRRMKQQFADTRTIFVADRGLNTSDNIYYINGDNQEEGNTRDGYLYGQSVRGADSEFKEWLLDQTGYMVSKINDRDQDSATVFRHKSRICKRKLTINLPRVNGLNQKTKTVYVDQKQMVYYSEKYAAKQKHDRSVMVERAKDLILHPKNYDRITSKGSASYVLNIAFDKTTGEIVEGRDMTLDLKKIEEEEKYDGYYSIVTSELQMDDLTMRDVYRGLIRIEDTFKVSKTNFRSRPVFVKTNAHIDAHFATCFTALVLIRLLEKKLDEQYPLGRILDSLKKYTCCKLENGIWMFLYYDEIIKACGTAFNMKLDQKYRRQEEMRRLLKY